ncbi:MAG: hypothetical protein ACMUIP_17570 [bacterium]
MWENKHLKAIPKATADQNGQEIIEVGAHRKGIVEELEKAHIYIEQLHKRITVIEEYNKKIDDRNKEMKEHNREIEERLSKLEAMLLTTQQ